MTAGSLLAPQQFFSELPASRAARRGEVIRRKVRDVERFVGRQVFLAEMDRRGFAVVENAGKFVIFWNRESLERLV